MFSLVYKDWLLQRGSKSFVYMMIMPVVSAFAFSEEVLFVLLPYIVGSYLFIVYANALDDKYQTEKAFAAMPVKRSDIVLAKYLSVGIYLLLFILAITVLSFLIMLIIPGFEDMPVMSFPVLSQLMVVASLYYGIFFPLYFRLGYQKSRWANYIALIASMGLFALVTKGASELTGISIGSLQEVLFLATGLGTHIWNPILIAATVIITAVSFTVSVEQYGKREFL